MFGDDGTARTKLLAHLGFSSPSDDNRDAQSQEIPSISDKEEWTLFCDTHASKLMAEGETLSATLCFIYSGDIDKTVEAWSRSLASNHDGKSFVDLLQVRFIIIGNFYTSFFLIIAINLFLLIIIEAPLNVTLYGNGFHFRI